MPINVRGSMQGTAAAAQQTTAQQPLLIMAAIVVIYIVLGVLYESLVHPMTVLSTLPSAGVGAVLALMLFGMEFSLIALIGVFLLIGIVKKNAIMIIDFALEAERSRGLSAHDAVREACLLRFRPILMTTLAAALGALPLAIGFGEGSELRQPLGIAIIGGLIASQLLTLLTTPVVYLLLDKLRRRSPDEKMLSRHASDADAGDAGRPLPPHAAPRPQGIDDHDDGHSPSPCAPRRAARSRRQPARARRLHRRSRRTRSVDAPTSAAYLETAARLDGRRARRHAHARPVVDAVQRPGAEPAGAAGRGVQPERRRGRGGRRGVARRRCASSARRSSRRCRSTPASRARASAATSGTTSSTRRHRQRGSSRGNRYSLGLGASWEPDLWGRIANTVSAATATAQASEADLANATLSAQTTFVTDYLSVREADAEIATLKTTIVGYQRALTITQNRYNAAIAQKSDVLQAQTTLANAQADLAALQQQRAQLFHAMAVLAGQPPATFALPRRRLELDGRAGDPGGRAVRPAAAPARHRRGRTPRRRRPTPTSASRAPPTSRR